MIIIKQKIEKYVALLLVGIILAQNPPWFIWRVYYPLMTLLIAILLILSLKRLKTKTFSVREIILILSLTAFFFILSIFNEVRISSLISVITFILMLTISDEEGIRALRILTKTLSITILISLSAWLIHNNLYSLPMYGTLSYGEGKGADQSSVIDNYFLFIEIRRSIINRFYSVFDEPGVIGTLAAFILYANQYDFKNKHNIIIFIGGVFTFSLAFIVLIAIGFMLSKLTLSIKFVSSIFLLLILIGSTYFILKENETFQLVVIGRIMSSESSGLESRTSYDLNNYYDEFKNTTSFFTGKGTSFFTNHPELKQGQSHKIFFIEYGLTGFLLVLLMYLALLYPYNKMGVFYLLLFIISFLQRPFMLLPWQIIIFTIGIKNLDHIKRQRLN